MFYARYTDLMAPTWSLVTGTAKTNYPVANLGDHDPSAPHWINETTIRVVADHGSAKEVQAVFIFAHTFEEALTVRVQANATNVWTSPTLNEVVTIPAWYRNGFSCHAWIDLVELFPSAVNRTFRYWSITNAGDANNVSVAIGEIVLVSTWRELNPSLAHNYQRGFEDLSSEDTSKKGVKTVYDLGSRDRDLSGAVARINSSELDTVLDWMDDQRGRVRPMVIVLDPDASIRRDSEPRLVRFTGARRVPTTIEHGYVYDMELGFDELGQGEVIGA